AHLDAAVVERRAGPQRNRPLGLEDEVQSGLALRGDRRALQALGLSRPFAAPCCRSSPLDLRACSPPLPSSSWISGPLITVPRPVTLPQPTCGRTIQTRVRSFASEETVRRT